jgi:molybdopterin molybdotransferase
MILFEEALSIVKSHHSLLPSETVDLADACGRILASDVFSDMDMPPFDKSAVDGYACRKADLDQVLRVLETIPAGKQPELPVGPGECSKLMTGGMMPEGADTVIMVEDTEIPEPGYVRFTGTRTSPNFCPRAEDVRAGQCVLTDGTRIRPQEIAVLAASGCATPRVYKQPSIGIISTGDELVEPAQIPGPSQIRNSNSSQLLAQAAQAGCATRYFGIARDTETDTLRIIQEAAAWSDIVILSGGISAGDFDFVPQVIQKAGFEIRIRSLAVQPGKPLIFATRENKYLVALPGNPVSSFVQFEMLVKYLIALITGDRSKPRSLKVPMGADYIRKRASRKAFFPVSFAPEGSAVPADYHGSAHIHSYIHAEGIVSIEIGETEIKKGTLVDVRLI